MNLDCADLAEFDAVLYGQLVSYPAEVIVLLDQEAHTIWAHCTGAPADAGPQFTVRHLIMCFGAELGLCVPRLSWHLQASKYYTKVSA